MPEDQEIIDNLPIEDEGMTEFEDEIMPDEMHDDVVYDADGNVLVIDRDEDGEDAFASEMDGGEDEPEEPADESEGMVVPEPEPINDNVAVLDTNVDVRQGDRVAIMVVNNAPTVMGVVGGGDRTFEDVSHAVEVAAEAAEIAASAQRGAEDADSLAKAAIAATGTEQDVSEATGKVLGPNLTPYFSRDFADSTYWQTMPSGMTKLEDGWAHFEFSNTGDSAIEARTEIKNQSWVNPPIVYTVVIEIRNAVITSDGSDYGGILPRNGAAQLGNNGEQYVVVDSETSGVFRFPNRSYSSEPPTVPLEVISFFTPPNSAMSFDIRMSLYEGDYTGEYVPYVEESLKEKVDDTRAHFWADAGGAHVATVAGDISQGYSTTIGATGSTTGILLQKDAKNLASFTPSALNFYRHVDGAAQTVASYTDHGAIIYNEDGGVSSTFSKSAVAFFDGLGSEASNMVAQFGKNIARIGALDGVHTDITNTGMTVMDGTEQVAFMGYETTAVRVVETHEHSNWDGSLAYKVTDYPAAEPFYGGLWAMNTDRVPTELFAYNLESYTASHDGTLYTIYPYHYNAEDGTISRPVEADVSELPQEIQSEQLATMQGKWDAAFQNASQSGMSGYIVSASSDSYMYMVYTAVVPSAYVNVGDVDTIESSFSFKTPNRTSKVLRIINNKEMELPSAGQGSDALLIGDVGMTVVGGGVNAAYNVYLQALSDFATGQPIGGNSLHLVSNGDIRFWAAGQDPREKRTMAFGGGFLTHLETDGGFGLVDSTGAYYPALYDNGINLLIGLEARPGAHHTGQTIISSGHNGTGGNPTVYISVPRANNYDQDSYGIWHEGNLPQTAWANLPLNSACEAYSAGDTPRYRKMGCMVNVVGAVKPKSNIGVNKDMTIGTLPAGFRPKSSAMTICQGSGRAVWLLNVQPGGNLIMSRYRDENGYANVGAGAWLIFNVTFMCA